MSAAQRYSRRHMLSRAAGGGLGLSLSGLLRARTATAAMGEGPAGLAPLRSCILLFYYGGPSHLDTYDLKPRASVEIRGEFQPIATSVPGLQICEHLPRMARVMHHAALIRSMHHSNRLHDSASIETLTGRPSPNGDREEFVPISQFFPNHGATLSYLQRRRNLDVSHAALPFVFHNVIDVPCQGGGFLGAAYDPLQIQIDPAAGVYHAGALARQRDVSLDRIAQRRRLLDALDSHNAVPVHVDQLRRYYDRAYQLLSSDRLLQALDLTQESLPTRERYGYFPGGLPAWPDDSTPAAGPKAGLACHMRGQSLLAARRLVEAGVPFVSVYDFKQQGLNWDAHAQNFAVHKQYLLPLADQGLSALIEDLDLRGLLESTLIVALGEFGRTPQINGNAGRDHWPDCYTALLAGGGVRGGLVHGASDRIGAYPAHDPVTPADLAATIFWRLGVPPSTEIHDRNGRPWRIADGQPLTQLF